MISKKAWALAALLAFPCEEIAVSSQGFDPRELGQPEVVTMIQLLATPEKYYGRLVSVVGFLGLEFENERLYLHQEDYRLLLTGHGIWIDMNDTIWKDREKLDQHYVVVIGVFEKGGRRPNPSGVGGLTRIRLSYPWPNIREELREEHRPAKRP